MRRETLVTISKRTGFSISTVSRVLSGKAAAYRISQGTVEKITEEARRCNYLPSLLAKGLRTRRTNTLGLLVPCIDNPYFANMSSAVIAEARKRNYTVLVLDTLEDEELERRGLESVVSRNVDGIILVPCGTDASFVEHMDHTHVPVVLVDRYYAGSRLPYVCTDNYRGGFEATRELILRGHSRIHCIRGMRHSMPGIERERGYREALRRYGFEAFASVSGDDFSVETGYRETQALLASDNRPTAIFAMSNTILLGAIRALNEAGLSIPDDMSVISFDNNLYLDYLAPPVTRLSQPVEAIAVRAVTLALERIAGKTPALTQIQLPATTIVRNSIKTL